MRPWLSFSLLTGYALLVFACANGTSSYIGAGLDEGAPDGASEGGPAVVAEPAAPSKDASAPEPVKDAAPAPVDSSVDASDGAPPKVDSGPPVGTGDCVGENSAQVMRTYDSACNAYYFNVGLSNPCVPGGNACAALDTPSGKFCCYKPKPGSSCYRDYFGTPQCLPK